MFSEDLVLLKEVTAKQEDIALTSLENVNRPAFLFKREDGLVAMIFVRDSGLVQYVA